MNEDNITNSSKEEMIFGKNAVLSFLTEQASYEEVNNNSHNLIQNALIKDAIEEAQRSIDKSNNKDYRLDELEKKIQKAVRTLKEKQIDGLRIPCTTSLNPGSGIKINKILLAKSLDKDSRIHRIKTLAKQQQITIQNCEKQKLDQLAGPQRRHQGVLALVSPAEMWKLDLFLQKLVLDRIDRELKDQSMDGYTLALLDGIEDPHNLGAIIRVAEAAGVKGLFLPQRRSVGLTGTVAKTSAGALASLPVVRVGNIVQCIETLKKYGFWVAALDLSAKENYTEINLKRPLLLVIGNEGSGVSRLVKEHCDLFLKIPMLGNTESLNASVAAGIVFYEVVRQNNNQKK